MNIFPTDRRLAEAERKFRAWSGKQISVAYRRTHVYPHGRMEAHLDATNLQRLFVLLVVVTGVAISIALGAMMIPAGREVVTPGDVLPMSKIVDLPGDAELRISAHAVTVDVRELKLAERLWVRPTTKMEIVPNSEYESMIHRKYNDDFLNAAKTEAEVVAFRQAGIESSLQGEGVLLFRVDPDSRAYRDGLRANDVVISVDGEDVADHEEFLLRINDASRSTSVEMSTRAGKSRTLKLPEFSTSDVITQHELRTDYGIGLLTFDQSVEENEDHKVEFTTNFTSGSAGPAFAAALYQALGHGEQAPEFVITGAMYVDGSLGPADYVGLKAIAVQREGIKYMLLHPSVKQEAKKAAPGVMIVPIENFDDVATWMDSWDETKATNEGAL